MATGRKGKDLEKGNKKKPELIFLLLRKQTSDWSLEMSGVLTKDHSFLQTLL